MANRDLLKEAIADAKALKETAIANAKVALEEAFAPQTSALCFQLNWKKWKKKIWKKVRRENGRS